MRYEEKIVAKPFWGVCVMVFALFIGPTESRADLVLDDSGTLVQLGIVATPAPVAGYVNVSFTATVIPPSVEISSIAGSFESSEMRQVLPAGQSTLFSDLNPFFGSESPLSDSQFLFHTVNDNLLIVPSQSIEDSTEIAAAFTILDAGFVNRPIAQVVLPQGETGMASLEFALRSTNGGPLQRAVFSPFQFSATAVPEPSAMLMLSLLAICAGAVRMCRRSKLT